MGEYAATIATTHTGVDLDRSRCARVEACRVARVVVKETVDMVALLRRLPLEGQTTRT